MDVGERIKKIREKRGLQQVELANKIKISQTKMNKIETGYQKKIEPDILLDIANALNVSTDHLLGKTEKKDPKWNELTEKNERDIAKRMEKLRQDLTTSDGLSFHGEPMSEEAIESLLSAIEHAERIATLANKKYIPKKYRKDNKEG